jgi:hypothetical protein
MYVVARDVDTLEVVGTMCACMCLCMSQNTSNYPYLSIHLCMHVCVCMDVAEYINVSVCGYLSMVAEQINVSVPAAGSASIWKLLAQCMHACECVCMWTCMYVDMNLEALKLPRL